MSTTMPMLVRGLGRTGLRIACSGALAIGLLATAPSTDAHAMMASSGHAAQTGHKSGHQLTERQRTANRISRAVGIAVHQKGDPYAYGAAGPSRFDCSGLTFFSYRHAGFKHIPRTSSAQAHFAKRIPRSAMRRGDLIFFYDGGGVYHVGVYAGFNHGHRWVLHAPYSGTRVRTDKLWTNQWYAGTLRFR
ncbi:C40 family peptidase [Nocardioides sp. CN2-186]|uniref:C40 family peptidase n=1 Tax=Nocardioides tweenelious TaxID=3156607 RepID=UPI0032B5536B